MDEHDERLPGDPDPVPGDPSGAAVGAAPGARRRAHGRPAPAVLAAVAAGGMLGASARYGVTRWLPGDAARFPWATFWTNLAGSFLLGLLVVVLVERVPADRYLRPFLATGILGAFTTLSTAAVETALLVEDGAVLLGVAYGAGSLAAGLAVAWAGIAVGRLSSPRRRGSAEAAP